MKLAGHLDRCDPDRIDGWVVDQDDPGQRIRLEVWAGREHLGHCIADVFRTDLAKAGMGDGHCAFRFAPPAGLTPEALRLVRLRIGDTGHVFRFGHGPPVRDAEAPEAETESAAPRKRFRTCVLHIGTEKTGTTSLQTFLGLNRKIIEDGGYFVPASLAPHAGALLFNHNHLAAVALTETKFDEDLRGSEGVHDAASLATFRDRIRAAFEAEIAAAPAHCETLILSNEHCHSRLLSIPEVTYVKEFLAPWCDEFKVVVYLRAQHELAMSQYGMMVLNGVTDIDMLPPLPYPPKHPKRAYTNRYYFDYEALLARWSEVFGEAAMQPRLFARHLLKNGNVIDDFMQDVVLPEGTLKRSDSKNTNVSASAQKFLINLYRVLDERVSSGAHLVGERIRNAVRQLYPGNGVTPARGEVAAFMAQFQESNEKVRARWFPDLEELFGVDLLRYPETAESNDLPPEELYRIFVDIFLEDQRFAHGVVLREKNG